MINAWASLDFELRMFNFWEITCFWDVCCLRNSQVDVCFWKKLISWCMIVGETLKCNIWFWQNDVWCIYGIMFPIGHLCRCLFSCRERLLLQSLWLLCLELFLHNFSPSFVIVHSILSAQVLWMYAVELWCKVLFYKK